MKCLSFENLTRIIEKYDPENKPILSSEENRCWKKIIELNYGKLFAIYSNLGSKYEEVCEDEKLDTRDKIDVFLRSRQEKIEDINFQVVDANEFNQNPQIKDKIIDLSGNCITRVAQDKCSKYCNTKINTQKIILLIYGVDVSTKIEDLVKDIVFLRKFEILPCFKEIYYITFQKMYSLKKLTIN